MEKSRENLLTLTEYFLVESTATKKPYLDENGACFLFATRSDAKAFSDELEDIKIIDAKYYRLQFVTQIYSYGVKTIKIKPREGDFKEIPVEKKDTKKQYLNEETCFNVTMLRQTKKRKYAMALKKGLFIAPVLIDPRIAKRYPELHYSCAVTDKDERFYTLFTSLKEFEEWNKDQPQDWKPVEMQLHKVGRIRKNGNILINPLSDMIILQDKQIAEILKG